jgi:hypothetical protein
VFTHVPGPLVDALELKKLGSRFDSGLVLIETVVGDGETRGSVPSVRPRRVTIYIQF